MVPQAADLEATTQRFASLLDSNQQVTLREAVCQRVDLHPQAGTQQIAAMLEFDGIPAPVEMVQEVLDER